MNKDDVINGQKQAVMTLYDIIYVTSTFLYVTKDKHKLTLGTSLPHLSGCPGLF
jgi:hypothetical protein